LIKPFEKEFMAKDASLFHVGWINQRIHQLTATIVWWMRPGLSTLQKLQTLHKSAVLCSASLYASTAPIYMQGA